MQEGDLALCSVERIEGTTVFVKLASGEKGTIITSEIAPGRIRNIRDYVVPNKVIVCKVLRIVGNNIELSLRRVSSKEKKDILSKLKQEQSAKSGFYQILKDKAKDIEQEILKKFPSLHEFLNVARDNEKIIFDFIPKEFHEPVKKLIQKKQKEIEVKKLVELKCLQDDGIVRIKKVLSGVSDNIKVSYLAAGKFQLTIKSENYKKANQDIENAVRKIEGIAKNTACEFEVIEK